MPSHKFLEELFQSATFFEQTSRSEEWISIICTLSTHHHDLGISDYPQVWSLLSAEEKDYVCSKKLLDQHISARIAAKFAVYAWLQRTQNVGKLNKRIMEAIHITKIANRPHIEINSLLQVPDTTLYISLSHAVGWGCAMVTFMGSTQSVKGETMLEQRL